MISTNSPIQNELNVLKFLTTRKLLPVEIAAMLGVDIQEVHKLVAALMQKGLISKMSDGFSTFFFITRQGSEMLNEHTRENSDSASNITG
ncbi:MAG: MarR family transcriptional regulator [Nitrososphaerota archaeon]|nr:MarR family transcriptional regulator [Nitrososphaerota archaeon]